MRHTHRCPNCKLLFTRKETGEACQHYIAEQSRKYCGKRKKRHRNQASDIHTCGHCGETELADADMEPMRDGLPSECCRNCWSSYLDSITVYNDEQIQRATRITGRPRLELVRGLFE